jgi:hypothetical protein
MKINTTAFIAARTVPTRNYDFHRPSCAPPNEVGHEPTREAAMAAFAKSWRRFVVLALMI